MTTCERVSSYVTRIQTNGTRCIGVPSVGFVSFVPGHVFDVLIGLPLPDYRLALSVGLVLGLSLAVLRGRRRGLTVLAVVDGALAAAVGGLLGGRLVYVATQWGYFHDHLGSALAVWQGGLSAPGALIGGVGGVLAFSTVRQRDPRPLLDALVPSAALIAACAWIGCLKAGCSCGVEAQPGQGLLWSLSAELPDLYGLRVPRVAVQALGAAWNLAVVAAVLLVGRRRAFPLWLLLHASGDFALAFLRGDLGGYGMLGDHGGSPLQVADLALALIGLLLLALPWWDHARPPMSSETSGA